MTLVDDTIRGLTLGDPDGPLKFVESLGREVPTYINPRDDLKATGEKPGTFKRLNYHVPFAMRGEFKVSDWPEEYIASIPKPRVDVEGYVLCAGASERSGGLCGNKAKNRTHFCQNHGGALHRCDKKMSKLTLAPMDEKRVEKMDRPQRFMQGFLEASDLEDDEVQGGFVRNDQGMPVNARLLGYKFEQKIAKELHARLNRFLQSKASSMLNVVVDIAENDLYEAADRVKAAIWVSERVIGKTPDVIIHGQTQAAYESILAGVEGGSREDYRKGVVSERLSAIESNGQMSSENTTILDVEVEEGFDAEGNSGTNSSVVDSPQDERSGLSSVEDGATDRSEENSRHSEGYDDTRLDESAHARADRITNDRQERLDRAKRIRKAKQRRFAARAVGATSLDNQPWLVELKRVKGKTGFKLNLIPPDKQTPALVERILSERSWEPPTNEQVEVRRAEAADEEVAMIKAKLEKLEKLREE